MPGHESQLLRLTIEVDPNSVPITGRLEQEDKLPREFEGILELVSLVEEARRSRVRPA